MKNQQKFIRLYGECRDGQWTLICLDFSLAAQDESLAVAKSKLQSQIASYVKDAQGVDAAHADDLLSRSAPFVYWAKFYFYGFLQALAHKKKHSRGHIAAKRPMAAILAAA